jgi:pseudouridine-5'-phosphate glycosidase
MCRRNARQGCRDILFACIAWIADATAARSIPANLALAESNAALAAAIAVAATQGEATAR